jgi:oligopeptidase B
LPFGQTKSVKTGAHTAPIAPIVPKRFEAFGGVRIDNYDWLRDRKDQRVVAYLNAENAYADACLEPIKPLVEEAREAQEDASVPAAYNGYIYERRFSRARSIHTSCAARMSMGRRRKLY